MAKSSDDRWPEVTSPVARRVLAYLAKLQGCYTGTDFLDAMDYLETDRQLSGLEDLWKRIQGTDIARLIAAGPGSIPDIASSMTGLNRLLYRLAPPRTIEQQIEGFVFNLEWYMSPDTTRPVLHIPKLHTLLLLVFLCLYALFMWRIWLTGIPKVVMTAFLVILYIFYWCYSMLFRIRAKGYTTFNTRATVLYHYLLREFSEPVEEDDAD